MHAQHYLALAEAAAPHLTGHEAGAWLARLDADLANLRTAFDWLALEEPELLPRLALSLWRFWLVRGLYDEGQTAIERALRLDPAPAERAELRLPARRDRDLTRRHRARAARSSRSRSTGSASSACSAARRVA